MQEVPETAEGSRLVDWLRRNRTVVVAILSWVVFAAVAMAVYRITGDIHYQDVLDALAATPATALIPAAALTALSFACLVCYDVNALRHIGKPLPLNQVAAISFSAYAVGNTAGFGALSGGAIRYRGYTRLGLSSEEVGRVIAFVTLAFGLGLSVLTAVALLFFAGQIEGLAGVSAWELRLAAVATLALMGLGGWWMARRRAAGMKLPDLRTCLVQLAVTAADVAASASVLYVLLPPELHVHWPSFVALYAIAIGLGVLSHVPAGLGVFEAVIITAIGQSGATEAVLGSLVLYRLVYHVLPLVIAVVLVAGAEVLQFRHSPVAKWAQKLGVLLAPSLVAMLSLVCGVMLVFSSVLPTPAEDLDWLSGVIPIQLLEAAHFLSSLLGLGLVVAARGLTQRLDGAFWAALLAASLAFAFAFLKAIAPYEAAVLAVLIVALAISRRLFTRRASLFAQALTPVWIAAIAMIAVSAMGILFFVYKDVEYSNHLWWQFEFSEEAPRGLRAVLGVTIAASVIALHSLLRPMRPRPVAPTAAEIDRAVAIVNAQDNGDANLVRMGDKSLIFAEAGDAFIMYGVQGRSWICLFGPIGVPEAFPGLIWGFVEAARAAGGRAVIYQAAPDLLPACADAGLRGLKLGEMATVDLTGFDLQTSRRAEQRQALRRGERDGMSFALLPATEVPAIMDELQAISDGWLSQHEAREKGFALGRFDRDYVAQQPVAILRKEGRVVAFATVMVTDTLAEATLDLMRFAADAPRGAMDFLFASLLVQMKEQGYRRFNLGMAPLSGMATHASAPIWNHFGQTVFEHGERFYNFKGLRAFKSKFFPDWEPRYLVVGGGFSPMAALLDVTLLIGGGLKGVVGK
ncbi:MAG: bifunctional lysylphosphatidylglycerol flippase/synthetase MprF [Paracoccaceae bacterium]